MDEKLDQRAEEQDGLGGSGEAPQPGGAPERNEEGDAGVPDAGNPGAAVLEPPEEAIKRLTREQDDLRDRYLRLAADFDNFRKRVARERSVTWGRAQADVVSSLLDALDDLERVSSLDLTEAKATDLLAGVRLVERKILRQLESSGLEKVGVEGETFDPNDHEAVATAPAPSTEQEDLVAMVLQPGYRFGRVLLRPARVQVFVEADEAND
jgi:molecular chaperone GrpE